MDEIRFLLDTTTAGRSAAGLVYAGLVLRLNDFSFPDVRWTDFPVVALSWWTERAVDLLTKKSVLEDMRFMDGPYLIRVSCRTSEVWDVKFIRITKSGELCLRDGEVEATHFIRRLLEASQSTLELCQHQRWLTADSEKLAKTAGRLRGLLQDRT